MQTKYLRNMGVQATFSTSLWHRDALWGPFLNLIQNALKYRDPNRALAISITVAKQTDAFVEIAVSDTGMGISQEYAERIFKPLMRLHGTADIEGSGLGLPICARIAEAHGGRIYLDKAYRGGARFVVRLSAPPPRAVLH